jgi:signal peptidase II
MTFFVATFIFALDRIAKAAALGNMSDGQSIAVWPGLFHLTLVLNEGTAFGLIKGCSAFFAAVSSIVIVFIIAYVLKNRPKDASLSVWLGLILGGAVGNLYDRAIAGSIIDFLDFRIFPVFNIADSAITVGAVMLILRMLIHNAHPRP